MQFKEIDLELGREESTSAHEYLPDLKSIILGHFKEITGVDVGLKIKSENPNPEPKLEDVI